MHELSLRSLVRKGWAGRTALSLLTFTLVLDLLQPTLAQTEEPNEESPREIRGLVIFKIAFGTTNRDEQLIPKIGFSLSVSRPEDETHKPERFDLQTGAKLPEDDLEQIPTWSLQDLEPLAKQLPTIGLGQTGQHEDPAAPNARINGLSKYSVSIFTGK